MPQPLDNMWIQLAIKEMDSFEGNSEAYFKVLATGLTQRIIMVMCYFVSVRMGIVKPLQELEVEKKQKIWIHAKELGGPNCEQWKLIELSKALYVIQCFQTE